MANYYNHYRVTTRQLDDQFTLLPKKKGKLKKDGSQLYIPYDKAQYAIMHVAKQFILSSMGKEQFDFKVSLNHVCPSGKGEFSANTWKKVVPELEKCGFVGTKTEGYTGSTYQYQRYRMNGMDMEFKTNNNNTKLIKRYLKLYNDKGCFKFDEPNCVKFINSIDNTNEYAVNRLLSRDYTMRDCGIAFVRMSDENENTVNKKIGKILDKNKLNNVDLAGRVWAFFNKNKFDTFTFTDTYGDECSRIVSKDFDREQLLYDTFKSFIVHKCCENTEKSISLSSYYDTVNCTSRNSVLEGLKNRLEEIQNLVKFVEDINVETIFTFENIERVINDGAEQLKRFKEDETEFQNVNIRSLSDNEDEVDTIIKKVQFKLDALKIDQDFVNSLAKKVKLSLKMQRMAA